MKIHVRCISLQLRFRRLFFQDLSSDRYNYILYKVPMEKSVNKKGRVEYSIAIPYYKDWLLGAMRPIVDCWHDLVDTFKPYKTLKHLKNEALQPIFGIANILFGILTLTLSTICFLAVIVFFVASIPKYILSLFFLPFSIFLFPHESILSDETKSFYSDFLLFSFYMFSFLVEGVTTIIRGALQIITYPFTLLIKIPFRALVLTPILGFQKFVDDRGIKRLVEKLEPPFIDVNEPIEALVNEKIRTKIEKAAEQGRKLPYNSISENICFFKSQRLMNSLEPVTHFMLNKQKFSQLVPKRQLEIAKKIASAYLDCNHEKQNTEKIVQILKEDNLYVQRDIRTLIWAAKKGHIKGNYNIPKDVVRIIAGFMRPL